MNQKDLIETTNWPRYIVKLGELGHLDGLNGTAKYLLLAMATFMRWETGDDGEFGDVGYYNETLSKKTGLADRTLRDALKSLLGAGLIERVEFRSHGGFRRRTKYNIAPAILLAKERHTGTAEARRSGGVEARRSSSSSSQYSSIQMHEEEPPYPLAPAGASSPAGDVCSRRKPRIQKSQKDKLKKFGEETGFFEWYDLYGKKVNPYRALWAWYKLSDKDRASIMENTRDYLERRERAESAAASTGAFVYGKPHPSTFLNESRWLDEFDENELKSEVERDYEEYCRRNKS